MKVYNIDTEKMILYVCFDYWEIEEMGYDIIHQNVVLPSFYSNVLDIIESEVKKYFPKSFKYGVKTYNDKQNGYFIYKVYKYSEALNDYVFSEMNRLGRNVFFYPNHICVNFR